MSVALGHAADLGSLSARERSVAARVMAGEGTQQIALELSVSPRTVEHHLASIHHKLGTRRRAELVALLNRLSYGARVPGMRPELAVLVAAWSVGEPVAPALPRKMRGVVLPTPVGPQALFRTLGSAVAWGFFLAGRGLAVGLHAGDCRLGGPALEGRAVTVAAAIGRAARGGQLLTSAGVAGLLDPHEVAASPVPQRRIEDVPTVLYRLQGLDRTRHHLNLDSARG
jgi:DNA-binding CsgD family transcriptional regulator